MAYSGAEHANSCADFFGSGRVLNGHATPSPAAGNLTFRDSCQVVALHAPGPEVVAPPEPGGPRHAADRGQPEPASCAGLLHRRHRLSRKRPPSVRRAGRPSVTPAEKREHISTRIPAAAVTAGRWTARRGTSLRPARPSTRESKGSDHDADRRRGRRPWPGAASWFCQVTESVGRALWRAPRAGHPACASARRSWARTSSARADP